MERQWIITQARKDAITESDMDYQLGAIALQELSLKREYADIGQAANIYALGDWETRVVEYLTDLQAGLDSLNIIPKNDEERQEIFEFKKQTVNTLVKRVTIDHIRQLQVEISINLLNLSHDEPPQKMTPTNAVDIPKGLKERIKIKSRQLGFILAGVTSSETPEHFKVFEDWVNSKRHGSMNYLAEERSLLRRADPKQILPECKSILVLAIPYSSFFIPQSSFKISSYALGDDYHDIIPPRLQQIVDFIEEQVGHPIPNRYYTDTGPILERELAQRAGLGWIGKNSLLINPKTGSSFFLAEILLGIEVEPDEPFTTDHCGTCTRCITACPTQCILPDRTIDARRCISYLTIELKEDIPEDLRPFLKDWIFGCDICQQVCPWNRFSAPADSTFEPKIPLPVLTSDLILTPVEFNQRFKKSPIRRAKRRGYLRNLAVAIGNKGSRNDFSILEQALQDDEPIIREHAKWAKEKLERGLQSAPTNVD